MTSIVAVTLETESGDSYLFLKDNILTATQLVNDIEQELGGELEFVDYWVIVTIGDIVKSEINIILSNRINQLRDNED